MSAQIVVGDPEYDGRVILYILKADPTNYINFIKPIVLAKELQCPHVLSIIDTKDEWYYAIHPERYVPALRDQCSTTGKSVVVFESTACLQYLAEKFDVDGVWLGKTQWERAQVMSWTEYQTAGLGPTAKFWLYYLKGYPNRTNPESLPKTTADLKQKVIRQWDILEKRLSGQGYIALDDRPTIADISYFPFAMPWMFQLFGQTIDQWPHIARWAGHMMARPAVEATLKEAPLYGHHSGDDQPNPANVPV